MLFRFSLMPRILCEPFLQCPFLQVTNKISVSTTLLLRSASSSSRSSWRAVRSGHHLTRRRIIGRAGLKSNWLRGVQMAGNSLDCRWDTALLLLHCGRTLSVRAHTPLLLLLLLVHVWLVHVAVRTSRHLLRCLRHDHLSVLASLRCVR